MSMESQPQVSLQQQPKNDEQKRRWRPRRPRDNKGKDESINPCDGAEGSRSVAQVGESSSGSPAIEAQNNGNHQNPSGTGRRSRAPRPRKNASHTPVETNASTATNSEVDSTTQPPRRKRNRNRNKATTTVSGQSNSTSSLECPVPNVRRRAFGAQLSVNAAPESPLPRTVINMRPEAPAFTQGPEDIATRIHREIASGSYECMVCYGGVTRKAKIWSCKCCWAVYHLNCIQKWGKQGLEQESRAPIGVDGEPPRTWRCPACNNPNRELPDIYTCWCGKDTHPESNRYTPPHRFVFFISILSRHIAICSYPSQLRSDLRKAAHQPEEMSTFLYCTMSCRALCPLHCNGAGSDLFLWQGIPSEALRRYRLRGRLELWPSLWRCHALRRTYVSQILSPSPMWFL